MKHLKRFFAAFLFALLFASLSTCAPNSAVSAVTPTPEATSAPTATLTPEPTEVPTPTVDEFGFSEERKAELNQHIQDFLNYQGEFTREKIFEMMMEPATDLDKSEVGLGIATSTPEAQGYFFDYFEKDNKLFMLMGFDGKDGNRFVTPVEISLYFYEQSNEATFGALEYKANSFKEFDDTEAKGCNGRNEIIVLLNTLKSKVITLGLNIWTYKESDADSFGQVGFDYVNELNTKIDLSFGLFSLMSSNNIHYDSIAKISDTSSIIKLENLDNLNKIKESQVPILESVTYFQGILDSK